MLIALTALDGIVIRTRAEGSCAQGVWGLETNQIHPVFHPALCLRVQVKLIQHVGVAWEWPGSQGWCGFRGITGVFEQVLQKMTHTCNIIQQRGVMTLIPRHVIENFARICIIHKCGAIVCIG